MPQQTRTSRTKENGHSVPGQTGNPASHHQRAAFHHETAAHHHSQAAKHFEAGRNTEAGLHADSAHSHGQRAAEHGQRAKNQRDAGWNDDDQMASGGTNEDVDAMDTEGEMGDDRSNRSADTSRRNGQGRRPH